MSLTGSSLAMPKVESWADQFLAGVRSTEPVSGFTHNYYRYPARFSPCFARAAIEAFSRPGDVVVDPFIGGRPPPKLKPVCSADTPCVVA